MLTFGGTMARWTPEARYDGSDCFTVFGSKNEEAHHSPFFKKKSLFQFIQQFLEIFYGYIRIALHVVELFRL